MPPHQNLQKRAEALNHALTSLADPRQVRELIRLIRKPGWTTPAELIFVSAIVESMLAHAAALTKLKANLLKGSQVVAPK